jgi:hypothetical protein
MKPGNITTLFVGKSEKRSSYMQIFMYQIGNFTCSLREILKING